jgi:hypothetical protein
MKSVYHLGVIAPALLMLTLLTSCGGGGSSGGVSTSTTPGATTEVINGITVPVAPDATANAATLKGVDSNNNGVRDDVERKIAAVTTSPADNAKSLVVAKTYQTILSSPAPTTRAEALAMYKPLICLSKLPGAIPKVLSANSGDTSIEYLVLDSISRQAAFETFNAKLAFVATGEVTCD